MFFLLHPPSRILCSQTFCCSFLIGGNSDWLEVVNIFGVAIRHQSIQTTMKRQLEAKEEPLSKIEKREEEEEKQEAENFKKTWSSRDSDANCAILHPLFQKLGKLYPNFQDIQSHLVTKTFVMTMLQMLPKDVQNEMSECAVNFFDALEKETWINIPHDDQYRMALQMRDTLITGIPLEPSEIITPEPNTTTEDEEDVGDSYYGPNDCSLCGRFMGEQCTSQCCYKTWCDKKPLRRVVNSNPPSSPPPDNVVDAEEVERQLRCCIQCGKDMGTMKASQTCSDCIYESHKIKGK